MKCHRSTLTQIRKNKALCLSTTCCFVVSVQKPQYNLLQDVGIRIKLVALSDHHGFLEHYEIIPVTLL